QSLSFNDLLVRLNDALTGTSGTQLATMIGQRYPVAMIDEFQDTDQLQYNIFKQIYFAHDEICLIMIGDPKQAIYSFRGGDIFTYMQVKQDIGTHHLYTLNTNWRSTPPVITAINALFSNRSSSFVYDSIPFLPAHSVDEEIKPAVYLMRNDIQQPALTIWNFPLGLYGDKNKPVSKENAAELCHQAVAEEIAALLTEAQSGTALLGDKLLQPKDIAILVRSHREAAELRQVLHKYNINAVSIEKTGVFSTDEAIGLDILLKAVLVPADRSQVRQALSSSLLNYDHIKIDSIVNNENQWLDWLDKVSSLHAVWQRKGFMPMFQRMLVYLNIEENMGGQSNAERKLTNLLHLGELIQKNSKMHPGMDALYNWFRQQREEEASDETQLRLETDEDLVQIVTIHSSKGLEYPVVFVPYLWSCRACNINEPLQFHKNNQACIDLGSEEKQQHLNLAEQERLAEDLRLTYVALTRAKSCLYLAWGMVGQGNASGKTALAYLMHPHQATESLSNHLPDAFVSGFDINDDLKQLADKSEQCICVQELKLVDSASVLKHTVHADELMARKFSGRISSHWRVNSFSALTRNIHPPGHSRVLEYNGPVSEDPVLQFPAGSHVGSFLHLILEHLDFQTDIDIQSKELSLRFAERFDIDLERYAGIISIWMQRIINTHFNSDNELCLAGIPASKRLNEMEFDLATDNVDLVRLNTLLSEAAGCDVQGIDADTFSGMVTGIIDLVFEYEGRFYIADYKSNYLGPDFSFYDHDNMTNAIYGHRYDFQFILYTLALHRYLRQRITQYDYDQHFGGAYYLFLRGMHPESGSQQGIYFNKPELSLINKLDKEIFLPEGVLA
ncbi:MAG: exodeoxyribonuclease V subunit beta, partial [Gammaproteobacteria bacterium]|nr:exodeoxyribonuclease V subunit beta [Gammaproteobacteria bacterium]